MKEFKKQKKKFLVLFNKVQMNTIPERGQTMLWKIHVQKQEKLITQGVDRSRWRNKGYITEITVSSLG